MKNFESRIPVAFSPRHLLPLLSEILRARLSLPQGPQDRAGLPRQKHPTDPFCVSLHPMRAAPLPAADDPEVGDKPSEWVEAGSSVGSRQRDSPVRTREKGAGMRCL